MNITPELARIHAHICGDGYVNVFITKRAPGSLISHPRKNIYYNDWIMAYCNKSRILIDEFQNDLDKCFNKRGLYSPKKYEVRAKGSKKIILNLKLNKKNSKNWIIPNFIFRSSNKIIKNWLRAFFDDEATVDTKKRAIFVTSINRKGLFQVFKLLKKLKIKSKINGPYLKAWRLCIRSKNVIKYHDKISFLHPEKLEKIKIIKMGREGFS